LNQFASQLPSLNIFPAWAGFDLHPFSTVNRESVSFRVYFNAIKWLYFQFYYPQGYSQFTNTQ
jgi:hypothetical protein